MSMETPVSPPPPGLGGRGPLVRILQEDLRHVRASWYWFVILGVALVLLGVFAITFAEFVTFTTAIVFGYLMLVAGVFYIVGAFFTRGWGGFFLSLLAGVLHLAVGLIVVGHPVDAVLVYTLVMAVFFFVDGLFRIFSALAGQFRHWGWVLANGVITLLLGVMIWRGWPASSLIVIGLFLGIELVMSGITFITLGLNARKLPV
jgi:uncharacterized membrane protein HdeD (DUF308 family)